MVILRFFFFRKGWPSNANCALFQSWKSFISKHSCCRCCLGPYQQSSIKTQRPSYRQVLRGKEDWPLFFCFNAHKHLLQKGDLAGVYRWPWCGKNSLKEVVNVPDIFFRRSAASQASCTVEWRWRRTVYCFITFSPRNVLKTARFFLLLFCLWSFFTFLTCIQMLISEKFSWHNQPHRLGFSLSCFPWNGNFIPSWSEWGQETGKIFCSACAKWD